MDKQLHHRPNLDHLRSQAKSLLADLAKGDDGAVRTLREHLDAAKNRTDAEIKSAGFRLADAQAAIARRNGFASWPKLARHVEQLRSLEGVWLFDTLEVDGVPVPNEAIAESRLLIDGDRFRMESPEATYEGIFNIDVETDPHHIDIEFVAGPEAGNWNYGIFRLDGEKLELCLDMRGQLRPAAFETKPDSGHAYEVLRRESGARPANVDGGAACETPSAAPDTEIAANADAFAYVSSETLTKLQGKWKAEKIVRDGMELPWLMRKTARRVAKENEIAISIGGIKMIQALVRIDESQSPMHVDYLNIGGKAKGTTQFGVMEWRDDAAWFCMAAPGRERPTDFECPAGSQRTLSVWSPK